MLTRLKKNIRTKKKNYKLNDECRTEAKRKQPSEDENKINQSLGQCHLKKMKLAHY